MFGCSTYSILLSYIGLLLLLLLLSQWCRSAPNCNCNDNAANSSCPLLLLILCGTNEGFGIVITTMLWYCANRNRDDIATNSSHPLLLLLTCVDQKKDLVLLSRQHCATVLTATIMTALPVPRIHCYYWHAWVGWTRDAVLLSWIYLVELVMSWIAESGDTTITKERVSTELVAISLSLEILIIIKHTQQWWNGLRNWDSKRSEENLWKDYFSGNKKLHIMCCVCDMIIVHPKATILSCIPFVKYVGIMRILLYSIYLVSIIHHIII